MLLIHGTAACTLFNNQHCTIGERMGWSQNITMEDRVWRRGLDGSWPKILLISMTKYGSWGKMLLVFFQCQGHAL
jgi:hypothetical protein